MMALKDEIKQMYFYEHLTISEIMSALRLDLQTVVKAIREGP